MVWGVKSLPGSAVPMALYKWVSISVRVWDSGRWTNRFLEGRNKRHLNPKGFSWALGVYLLYPLLKVPSWDNSSTGYGGTRIKQFIECLGEEPRAGWTNLVITGEGAASTTPLHCWSYKIPLFLQGMAHVASKLLHVQHSPLLLFGSFIIFALPASSFLFAPVNTHICKWRTERKFGLVTGKKNNILISVATVSIFLEFSQGCNAEGHTETSAAGRNFTLTL